jgi:hypothetical protein
MFLSPELRVVVALFTTETWLNPSKELRLPIVGLQTTKREADPRSTKTCRDSAYFSASRPTSLAFLSSRKPMNCVRRRKNLPRTQPLHNRL